MKDGYHVICTVSSNVLLDKGHVAKGAKRVSLIFFYIFYFPIKETFQSFRSLLSGRLYGIPMIPCIH